MVNHLISLLDYSSLDKVFVVSHDWGTLPASRFVLYYPERTLGLVLLSIGYQVPGMLDFDQALKNSKEFCEFETLGYRQFFDSDEAAKFIESNLESFIDLLFASNATLITTALVPLGKLRQWLRSGRRTNRVSFMTEDDFDVIHQFLVNAVRSKLNWYKAAVGNINWNDEMNLDPNIKRPVLFIRDALRYPCLTPFWARQSQYISDEEVIDFETGHWIMKEEPEAVNQAIGKWIEKIL
ncbi:unnamed protein product [Didymodactylos carnosus]|uniref:AB hydrolase-1 domain-containing protein n=1 Tax=Didymodactylos carnosus TaxID=1234261 RepID=A0A814X8K6_9BILA|nr:unnamed protein product [Didymodactylos carnosus]CAF1212752.1 unnamed protein product [Didymodactylos carnosus]CAF3555672.1 unnamed protein product [Didymodactylos carnosus]CAF3976717.1 unnamed protein product [Didymodactylos carnosus]